jgi:hypothetical protein
VLDFFSSETILSSWSSIISTVSFSAGFTANEQGCRIIISQGDAMYGVRNTTWPFLAAVGGRC